MTGLSLGGGLSLKRGLSLGNGLSQGQGLALNLLGIDPVTSRWANSVKGQGGTVSSAQEARVNAFIQGTRDKNLLSSLDYVLPLASENTQQCYTDLIKLLIATPVAGPTFTASQGVAGAVSTTYVNTNFNPTTKLVAGSLNNFHISLYGRTNRVSGGNNSCSMGVCSAGFTNTIAFTLQPGTSPQAKLFANQTSTNDVSTTPGTSQGYWIINRTGATGADISGMRNGSALAFSATNSSTALANASIFIGNLSNNGAPNGANGVADQHAFVTIGAGLTAQQMTDLTTLVNAYMTSLGTNVF